MLERSDAVVQEYPSSQGRGRKDQDRDENKLPPPGVIGYSYQNNGYGKDNEVRYVHFYTSYVASL